MAGIQNTAGGKTYPKRGRLGSGAYWPNGVPINGNPFGPNGEQQFQNSTPAPRPFGSPGNAGNGTWTGQNRSTIGAGMAHPNSGFFTISQQPKIPAFTRDGGTGIELSPYHTNPVVQPHDRNRLYSRKVRGKAFKTVSGASRTLPSDTAFNRVPPLQHAPAPRPPQNYTLHMQRQGKTGPGFISKNQQWFDANNSFLKGVSSPGGGGTGKGRWHTVKRGAAG